MASDKDSSMLRVYLETTIPSYLTSRPSRDLVLAARQEMTREWWDRFKPQHNVYISDIVLREAAAGSPDLAAKRLAALAGIPLLGITEETIQLAEALVNEGFVPEKVAEDAAHIAIATVHDVEVLLTWNCTHLANVTRLRGMHAFIYAQGYVPPIICTPDDIMEED